MKKLMMFVAVAVCAVSVQAASISWGNTAALTPIVGPDGTTLTSANAASYSFIAKLINVTDANTVIASSSTINNMTPGSLSESTITYTYGTEASNGDVFRIELYASVGGSDYMLTITNPAWVIAAINDSGTDLWGGTWPSGSTAVGNWVLIPEPTAMALLALGAAAFGLRRRFRK